VTSQRLQPSRAIFALTRRHRKLCGARHGSGAGRDGRPYYFIAQDGLKSTTIQLQSSGGPHPVTPKEEQNANLHIDRSTSNLLDARLQLKEAKVSLLRQTGQLDRGLNPRRGLRWPH